MQPLLSVCFHIKCISFNLEQQQPASNCYLFSGPTKNRKGLKPPKRTEKNFRAPKRTSTCHFLAIKHIF